jgi:uncharacterized repeat protein (TIGR03803 family)
LYGNSLCGANDSGALWELSRGRLTLLHSFAGYPTEGSTPYGDLLRGPKGELYGTTQYGGAYDDGTVWSYVP